MEESRGSIAFILSYNSTLKTQNSALAVETAVSGYTGLWAGGSRDSILACVIHDGSSRNSLEVTAGPFAEIPGFQ
jgi:hypothetical protein